MRLTPLPPRRHAVDNHGVNRALFLTPLGWVSGARMSATIGIGFSILVTLGMAFACRAQVRLQIEETPINLDSDSLYEALAVRCVAVLDTPGTYQIDPLLKAEPDCEPLVPGTAFGGSVDPRAFEGRKPTVSVGFVKTDPTGRMVFTVYFDGDDLWRFEKDGPWHFCVSLLYMDNIDSLTRHPPGYAWIEENPDTWTRPWRYQQFKRRYGGELEPFRGHPYDFRSTEELIYTQGWDLIVATVMASDGSGTYEHPPHVRLRVDRTLYGTAPRGEILAKWAAPRLYMPCPVGEEGNIARWSATALPAPETGTRWILAGSPDGQDRWISHASWRREYSDSLRDHMINKAKGWPARLRMLERERAESLAPEKSRRH